MSEKITDKSFQFAIRAVNMYKYLCEVKKEYVLSKQLLRSGTSIGANVKGRHLEDEISQRLGAIGYEF